MTGRYAFKMFLNYDGPSGNGQFGNQSITANTSNISQSAVYAATDSGDPLRMTHVAINRTTAAKDVALQVTYDRREYSAIPREIASAC